MIAVSLNVGGGVRLIKPAKCNACQGVIYMLSNSLARFCYVDVVELHLPNGYSMSAL